jgi:hypothetical protein
VFYFQLGIERNSGFKRLIYGRPARMEPLLFQPFVSSAGRHETIQAGDDTIFHLPRRRAETVGS